MHLLDRGENGEDYHISPRTAVSIRELVEKICRHARVKFDDVVELAPDRLGKDQAYLLDSTKMKDRLGWMPRVSLDEGLERCGRWCREHIDLLKQLPQVYSHKP